MPDNVQVHLKPVLTHDELARILFGADLGPRWSKAKIRAEIQQRIITWGTAECLRRYKKLVAQAAEADELGQHFEQFNWYRAQVVRTYPPIVPRRRRKKRPAAVGRPLLDVLAVQDLPDATDAMASVDRSPATALEDDFDVTAVIDALRTAGVTVTATGDSAGTVVHLGVHRRVLAEPGDGVALLGPSQSPDDDPGASWVAQLAFGPANWDEVHQRYTGVAGDLCLGPDLHDEDCTETEKCFWYPLAGAATEDLVAQIVNRLGMAGDC